MKIPLTKTAHDRRVCSTCGHTFVVTLKDWPYTTMADVWNIQYQLAIQAGAVMEQHNKDAHGMPTVAEFLDGIKGEE